MKFRTTLPHSQSREIIDYSKKIFCVGSCFAEHLSSYLKTRKLDAFLNPCGITYNPISISRSLSYALGNQKLEFQDIKMHNGVYFHSDFHSTFSTTSQKETYELITNHLEEASHFADADVVILSLGTAFAYTEKSSGQVVNNCHKRPSPIFDKTILSVQEVVHSLETVVQNLRARNPNVEIIATVSPVRHLRDGMIQNNLSKSTLLLALNELKGITYFPSYELLMDDLRDYRFYDRDLVHPSSEAVEYILNYFDGQFLSEQEARLRERIVQVQKDLAHRPFLPDSKQHQSFLKNLVSKMESIIDETNVDFKEEIKLMKAKIK